MDYTPNYEDYMDQSTSIDQPLLNYARKLKVFTMFLREIKCSFSACKVDNRAALFIPPDLSGISSFGYSGPIVGMNNDGCVGFSGIAAGAKNCGCASAEANALSRLDVSRGPYIMMATFLPSYETLSAIINTQVVEGLIIVSMRNEGLEGEIDIKQGRSPAGLLKNSELGAWTICSWELDAFINDGVTDDVGRRTASAISKWRNIGRKRWWNS